MPRAVPSAGRAEGGPRATTYCVIPRELADTLHEPLRDHFRSDDHVKVVVDFRKRQRRKPGDRRGDCAETPEAERRRIHSETGRRVADRRTIAVPVDGPELPRRLRRHAEQIRFHELIEPTTQRALDLESA